MTDSEPQLQFTPQQQAALETKNVSIALSAGAGCGKTFVLTERFLRYLADHSNANSSSSNSNNGNFKSDPLSKIVAITFTDRAAREMRNRIRSACSRQLQCANHADAAYWLSILRTLETARITTIHSFCASLLRSAAVDAGIDPRFGLLDPALTDTLLRRAVTDTLHQLLCEHDDDCMELVLRYGLESVSETLISLVLGRFQGHDPRLSEMSATELANDWLERWKNNCVPKLLGEIANSQASKRLLTLLYQQTPDHAEMQRRCELFKTRLPTLASRAIGDLSLELQQLRDATMPKGSGGKKVWDNDEIHAEVNDALKAVRKLIDDVRKNLEAIDDADALIEAAQYSGMARRIVEKADRAFKLNKQKMGMLDYDDLLLKTNELLRNSESVRRRVAAGIDFLMVDEFQDTDPVQAEIVRNLCGERLLNGKLFLVGDVKQSIYRFRRADPDVFESLQAEIPEKGRLPLSRNFRSQPEILKLVNLLFAPAIGDSYEPLVPHVEQVSPTPCVEFLLSAEETDEENSAVSEKPTVIELRKREADWIARRIVELLNDETPSIRDKNPQTGEAILRRVRPGDITILFRALSNIAIYENALSQHDVDYYLVGGRAFYAQQEIHDVVNLLATLNDPDETVALAGLLRSPFFNLSDETLLAMVVAAGTLPKALQMSDASPVPITNSLPIADEQQQQQFRLARNTLHALRQQKDRLSLAELLQAAIDRTGYDGALLQEHLGRRKLANLDKLIEMARQHDRSGMATLAEFVQRIRDSIAKDAAEELAVTHPETSDVVRLMTIHQSKGLEFPVVILADINAGKTQGGGASPVFHPEMGPLFSLPKRRGKTPKHIGQLIHRIEEKSAEEAEKIRLFYVATTRAADRLILSAGMKSIDKTDSPWLRLLAEQFDLRTGLAKGDAYFGSQTKGSIGREQIPDILVHQRPPQIPPGNPSAPRPLPLTQFQHAVETAEPAIVPPTLAAVAAQIGQRTQFSVSAIRQAGAQLQNLKTPHNFDHTPQSNSGSSNARDLGNLLHGVIETFPLSADFSNEKNNTETVTNCLHNVAAQLQIDFTAPLQQAAEQRLQAFVRSSLFAEMTAAKHCHRELDFLLQWNKQPAGHPVQNNQTTVTISGQIDCLLFTNAKKWHVIDYKTGRFSKAKPEQIIDEYGLQLALYAFAVREIGGQLPEQIEIAVLHDEVVRVPISFNDDLLEIFENRITAAITELLPAKN